MWKRAGELFTGFPSVLLPTNTYNAFTDFTFIDPCIPTLVCLIGIWVLAFNLSATVRAAFIILVVMETITLDFITCHHTFLWTCVKKLIKWEILIMRFFAQFHNLIFLNINKYYIIQKVGSLLFRRKLPTRYWQIVIWEVFDYATLYMYLESPCNDTQNIFDAVLSILIHRHTRYLQTHSLEITHE